LLGISNSIIVAIEVCVSPVSASQPLARVIPRFDFLLATKLAPPGMRSLRLPRPRLTTLLARAAHMPLTLIAAPAGFGKTTLLCEWLARQRLEAGDWRLGESALASSLQPLAPRVAWLNLDAADSDPTCFWRYVTGALQTAAPETGAGALARLEALPLGACESVLSELLNDLAHSSHDIALILDDYHLIDSPAVHDSLAFLLDRMPARLHLIIATRVVPPLPLARLRARATCRHSQSMRVRCIVALCATVRN